MAFLPHVCLSTVAALADDADQSLLIQSQDGQPGSPFALEGPARAKRWADRPDAPSVKHSRGAVKWRAGTVITEQEKREALDALELDFSAPSARGPNNSVIRTWEAVHGSWFGEDSAPWPLTPAKIRAIAAVFKKRGYRSFANYASKAKERHISLTGEWPALLAQEMKMAKRSVGRGLGPSRQSEPLQLERISELEPEVLESASPLVPNGPVGPFNVAVLDTYFLLREIESSLSLATSVTVDEATKTVRWLLPSSKNDSAWRCPYHAAVRQRRILTDMFGNEAGNLPANLPFFPTREGRATSKEAVVETYKAWHRKCGTAVVDQEGNELMGGHSARTGGSVMLAGEGVHLYQIELLARWKSPMILHYARTAPLKMLSRDYVRNKAARDVSDRLDELAASIRELKRAPHPVPTQLERAEVLAAAIQGPVKKMVDEELRNLKHTLLSAPSCCVQNLMTRTWHKAAIDGMLHSPGQWKASCGWPFGYCDIRRSDSLPKGARLCEKCRIKDGDSSSGSESSDSDGPIDNDTA